MVAKYTRNTSGVFFYNGLRVDFAPFLGAMAPLVHANLISKTSLNINRIIVLSRVFLGSCSLSPDGRSDAHGPERALSLSAPPPPDLLSDQVRF